MNDTRVAGPDLEAWAAIDDIVSECASAAHSRPDQIRALIENGFAQLGDRERDALAREQFASEVRGKMRDRTRVEEHTAERSAQPSEAPRHGSPGKINGRKIIHGSWNKRNGGVPAGCDCEVCSGSRPRYEALEEHLAAKSEERMTKLASDVDRILIDYVENLKIEWTQELLDATFALGDGTLVRWGSASAEHHRQRIEMFSANARANVEGAARHVKALEAMELAGAACLDEVAR